MKARRKCELQGTKMNLSEHGSNYVHLTDLDPERNQKQALPLGSIKFREFLD
jgi:hypothetical protein